MHFVDPVPDCGARLGLRSLRTSARQPCPDLGLPDLQPRTQQYLPLLQQAQLPEDAAGVAGEHRELAEPQVPQPLLDEPRDTRDQDEDRMLPLRLAVRAHVQQELVEPFAR